MLVDQLIVALCTAVGARVLHRKPAPLRLKAARASKSGGRSTSACASRAGRRKVSLPICTPRRLPLLQEMSLSPLGSISSLSSLQQAA